MKSKLGELLKAGCQLRLIHISWCDTRVVRLEKGRKLVGYSESGELSDALTEAVGEPIGEINSELVNQLDEWTTGGKGLRAVFDKRMGFKVELGGFFGQGILKANDPDLWKAVEKVCAQVKIAQPA